MFFLSRVQGGLRSVCLGLVGGGGVGRLTVGAWSACSCLGRSFVVALMVGGLVCVRLLLFVRVLCVLLVPWLLVARGLVLPWLLFACRAFPFLLLLALLLLPLPLALVSGVVFGFPLGRVSLVFSHFQFFEFPQDVRPELREWFRTPTHGLQCFSPVYRDFHPRSDEKICYRRHLASHLEKSHMNLASMDSDPSMAPQGFLHSVVDRTNLVWFGHHVRIIQESKETLGGAQ